MKFRVAIVGFGNIGQEVFNAIQTSSDAEVTCIVTRDPERVRRGLNCICLPPIFNLHDESWLDKVDVAILCGGSKNDLPVQGPYYASRVNTVDSFDTHDHVGEYVDEKTGLPALGYFQEMDLISQATGHTAAVCQGWDPGLFSLVRAVFQAYLGKVRAYAFYGLTPKGGFSMGHTNAILGIKGVTGACQFTHAIPESIERVRKGEDPVFKPGDMHWRECFVAVGKEANKSEIAVEIKSMPNYFEPFRTEVNFVPLEEISAIRGAMPHDGLVIATNGNGLLELKVEWQSNPAGTAGILLACARATVRMNWSGQCGAYSAISIPAGLLLPNDVDLLKLV